MFDDDERHGFFFSPPTPSAMSRSNVQSPTEIWLNQADMNSCSSGWFPSPSGHRSHGSSDDSGILQCAHGAHPSPAARKKAGDTSRHSVLQNLFDEFLRDAHTKKQNAKEGGKNAMRDESGTTTASEDDEDDAVKVRLPHAVDVQRTQQVLMHNQVEQARQRMHEGWQRQLGGTQVDARDSAEELWRQEAQRVQQQRQQQRWEQPSHEVLQQQQCSQEPRAHKNTMSAVWFNGRGASYTPAPVSHEWASHVVRRQNNPLPSPHQPIFACAEHKVVDRAATRDCKSCAAVPADKTTVAPAAPVIVAKTRLRKLNMAANVLPRRETPVIAQEEDENARGGYSVAEQQQPEQLRQQQQQQQQPELCTHGDAYYTENRGRGSNRNYTQPIGHRSDNTRRTEQRAQPQQLLRTQYRSGQRSSQTTPCHTRQSSPVIADKESRRHAMKLRFDEEAFQGRRTGRVNAEDHKDGTRRGGGARERNFESSWRRLPEDDQNAPPSREQSCVRDGGGDKPLLRHKLHAASAPASLCGNTRPDRDYSTSRDGPRWRTWGHGSGTTRDDDRRTDRRELRPQSYYEPRRQTSCGGDVNSWKPFRHSNQVGVEDYQESPGAVLEPLSAVPPQDRDRCGREVMAESCVEGVGDRDEASVSDVSTLSESESPTRRVAEAWIAKQSTRANDRGELQIAEEASETPSGSPPEGDDVERRKETLHEEHGADNRAINGPESPIPIRHDGRNNDLEHQKHDEQEKHRQRPRQQQQQLREESWNKHSPKDRKSAHDGPDDVLSWRRAAVNSPPSTGGMSKGGTPQAGSWRTYEDGAKVAEGRDTRRPMKHDSPNNDPGVGRSLSQARCSAPGGDLRRGEARWKREVSQDDRDNDTWRGRQQSQTEGSARQEIESGSWRRHHGAKLFFDDNLYEYERGHAAGDSTRDGVNGTRRKRTVERNFDASWRNQSEHVSQEMSAPTNHGDERRVRSGEPWAGDNWNWTTDSLRREGDEGNTISEHGGRYKHPHQDAERQGWSEVSRVLEESWEMHTLNAGVDDTTNTHHSTNNHTTSELPGNDNGKGGRGAARRDDVLMGQNSDGPERRGANEGSLYYDDEDHGVYGGRKGGKSGGWRTPPEDSWTKGVDAGGGKRYASQASTQSGCPYSEDSWRKEGESNSSAVHESATANGRHASSSWMDSSDTESPHYHDIRAWQKNKASKTREDTNRLRAGGVARDNGATQFWRQEDCSRGDPPHRSTSGRPPDMCDGPQSARLTSSVVPRSLYMMQKPFEDAWNKLTEREMQDAPDASRHEDTMPNRPAGWHGQNEKSWPHMVATPHGNNNCTPVDHPWHARRENGRTPHTCADDEPEWRASSGGHARRPNGTAGAQHNTGRHGEDDDDSCSRNADARALRDAKQLYYARGVAPSSLRVDINEDSWRGKDGAGRTQGTSCTAPLEHRGRNTVEQLMNGDYVRRGRDWRTLRVPPWEYINNARRREPEPPQVPSNGTIRSKVPPWGEPRGIASLKPAIMGSKSTIVGPPWGKPKGLPNDSDTGSRRLPQQQQLQQLHQLHQLQQLHQLRDPPRAGHEAFSVIPEEDGTRSSARSAALYARTPSPDDSRWLNQAACLERDFPRSHYQDQALHGMGVVSAGNHAMTMKIPPVPQTYRKPPASMYPHPPAPLRTWEGSGIKRHKLSRLLRRGAKALRTGFLDALLTCPTRIFSAHSVEISRPHELSSSPSCTLETGVSSVRVMAQICQGMTSNMMQAKVYLRCSDQVYRLHRTPRQILTVSANQIRKCFVAEACIQKMVTLATLEKVTVPDIEIASVGEEHVIIRCLNLSGSFLEVTVLAPGREASMVRIPIKGKTEFEWRQAKLSPNEVYVAWCRVSDAAQEYWTKDSEQKGFKTLPKRKQTIWDISDFEILGVAEGAAQVEIKKGYKNKCLAHHPDKLSHDSTERAEAEDMMKRLNLAKENLLVRPQDGREEKAKKMAEEPEININEPQPDAQPSPQWQDENPWAHLNKYSWQPGDHGSSRDEFSDSPRNLQDHVYMDSPTDSPSILPDDVEASQVVEVNYSIFDSVQTKTAPGLDAIYLYINNLPETGYLEVKVERDDSWHTVMRKKLEGRFSECVLVDQLEHSRIYSAIIDVRVPLEPIILFPS